MTTYIKVNGNKHELSDKIIFFEEGEKVAVVIDGKIVPKTVISVRKIIRPIGEQADCDIEVILQ